MTIRVDSERNYATFYKSSRKAVALQNRGIANNGADGTSNNANGTIPGFAIMGSVVAVSALAVALVLVEKRNRRQKEPEDSESLLVRSWMAELIWAKEKKVNPVLAPYYVKPVYEKGEQIAVFKDVLEIAQR